MAQVQAVLRLHHYAIRTERSYLAWIRRYVLFHGMKSRTDLADGAAKVEAFLTHLAVVDQVAALSALIFLDCEVLQVVEELGDGREQMGVG